MTVKEIKEALDGKTLNSEVWIKPKGTNGRLLIAEYDVCVISRENTPIPEGDE